MSNQTMTVWQSVQLMKREGSRLAKEVPVDGMPSMTFSCSFAPDPATRDELAALGCDCPRDLAEFWALARTAKLFEDQQYGQWGVEILDPEQAAAMTNRCRLKRGRDFVEGDLVVGKFLGDSDLLVIRCDSSITDYGSVLVALPLDARGEWYNLGGTFASFLDTYVKSGGEKFWTKQDRESPR
ncbi:SMI1/KNR4 family protein [Candidatus Kaiserbacteria bacterium]|nr:SMI1/KNR4 family protein [Candidatus Kaiserbacteria bacterium]